VKISAVKLTENLPEEMTKHYQSSLTYSWESRTTILYSIRHSPVCFTFYITYSVPVNNTVMFTVYNTRNNNSTKTQTHRQTQTKRY